MRTDGRGERHGMSRTGEYRIYKNMMNRCYMPTIPTYARYGARGIEVCERWRASFSNLLCDMGRRPSSLHSLERKDNEGPYSPDNCRWATAQEQARNRRSNRLVEINGQVKTLAEWVSLSGISHVTLFHRLSSRWPDDLILVKKVPRSEIRNRGIIAYRKVENVQNRQQ